MGKQLLRTNQIMGNDNFETLEDNLNKIYDDKKYYGVPVKSKAELPLIGNAYGEIRLVHDEGIIYGWNEDKLQWTTKNTISELEKSTYLDKYTKTESDSSLLAKSQEFQQNLNNVEMTLNNQILDSNSNFTGKIDVLNDGIIKLTDSISIINLVNLKTYIHEQLTISAVWVINHNLDNYPSVTVVDSGETIVVGEIFYGFFQEILPKKEIPEYEFFTNSNILTIKFSGAFSGKAYLN